MDISRRNVLRLAAEAAAWGKPVVAENRAGGGGNIGTEVVARAPPDGYTLLANSSTHVINASLYEKLPYDPFNVQQRGKRDPASARRHLARTCRRRRPALARDAHGRRAWLSGFRGERLVGVVRLIAIGI